MKDSKRTNEQATIKKAGFGKNTGQNGQLTSQLLREHYRTGKNTSVFDSGPQGGHARLVSARRTKPSTYTFASTIISSKSMSQ